MIAAHLKMDDGEPEGRDDEEGGQEDEEEEGGSWDEAQ